MAARVAIRSPRMTRTTRGGSLASVPPRVSRRGTLARTVRRPRRVQHPLRDSRARRPGHGVPHPRRERPLPLESLEDMELVDAVSLRVEVLPSGTDAQIATDEFENLAVRVVDKSVDVVLAPLFELEADVGADGLVRRERVRTELRENGRESEVARLDRGLARGRDLMARQEGKNPFRGRGGRGGRCLWQGVEVGFDGGRGGVFEPSRDESTSPDRFDVRATGRVADLVEREVGNLVEQARAQPEQARLLVLLRSS